MHYTVLILFAFIFINPVETDNIRQWDKSVPRPIFFKSNSTAYSYEIFSSKPEPYEDEYRAMKKVLDNHPELLIQIHGYQNNKEKRKLAERRAMKVKKDLIAVGYDISRLTTIGEPPIPISDTTSKYNKALTQKVEFKFQLKK